MANRNFIKFGEWNKAGLLTANLKNDIKASNKLALQQLGLRAERLIVKYIERQPASWPALSEEYLKQKQRQGFSGLKLRRTSSLINAITSFATDHQVQIGVKRGKKYAGKGGKEEIANIAAIMEFGSVSRNIPPRPYLAPTHKHLLKDIKAKKYFSRFLLEYLKRKYSIHR